MGWSRILQIVITRQWTTVRAKWGRSRTFLDMTDGRYTQSDSAGGSTGTVRIPIAVNLVVCTLAHTLNRPSRPCAAVVRPYVKLLFPFVFFLVNVFLSFADKCSPSVKRVSIHDSTCTYSTCTSVFISLGVSVPVMILLAPFHGQPYLTTCGHRE